jgi:hypothetical protein
MSLPAVTFSDDQAEAFDRVSAELMGHGVDLSDNALSPRAEGLTSVLAVVGKAGSGKTMLLASLFGALKEAGVEIVSGDYEPKRRKERRSLAILAPTNKAASVLRLRGDYLAIVTLVFGEIVRIILINWQSFTGGPIGVSGIPRPSFFGAPFTNSPAEGVTARSRPTFHVWLRPV